VVVSSRVRSSGKKKKRPASHLGTPAVDCTRSLKKGRNACLLRPERREGGGGASYRLLFSTRIAEEYSGERSTIRDDEEKGKKISLLENGRLLTSSLTWALREARAASAWRHLTAGGEKGKEDTRCPRLV